MTRRKEPKVVEITPPPRKKAKRAKRRPRTSEDDTTAGEAHEFIRGVNDLRYAVETLTDVSRDMTETVQEMDQHNALLCNSIDKLTAAIDKLSSRIDIVNGVGNLVGRLLPSRR